MGVAGAIGPEAPLATAATLPGTRQDYAVAPVPLRIQLPPLASQAPSLSLDGGGPLRIGSHRPAPAEFRGDLSGRLGWRQLGDGTLVGAFTLTSPDAASVRLGLGVALGMGAELRFFNPAHPQQRYPALAEEDLAWGVDGAPAMLWSPSVEGDRIGVEVALPSWQALADFSLTVEKIAHRRLGFDSPRIAPKNLRCGNHIDVQCRAEEFPAGIEDAVARIRFEQEDGSYLCSGTLLNNSRGDFKPYFLTANHCVSSQSVARTIEADWFFQSERCYSQTLDGRRSRMSGGADLLTTSAEQDATLLRLKGLPEDRVFVFAGWNAAGVVRGENLLSIHHPKGERKKYSAGTVTDIADVRICDEIDDEDHCVGDSSTVKNAIHVQWSQGATEAGSSGGGLFDREEGRLVGVLSGGSEQCEGGNDSFGSFGDFFPQAQRWLSPMDSSGRDDHGNARERATDLALNVSTAGRLEQPGDVDYFRLRLGQSGTLRVETSGATDTFGYLQNAEGRQLEQDDDDGPGSNFRMVRRVSAGTYYVAVVGANGRTATGAYALLARFAAEGGDDHGNARERATELRLQTPEAGHLERPGDVDYFRLRLGRFGTLKVETRGIADTFGYLQDADGRQLGRDGGAGDGPNFRIVRPLAPGAYYVAVVGDRERSATGAYSLVASLHGGDDHGNARGQATDLTPNRSTAGQLERPGDVDYFRLQLAQAGELRVETSGATDTFGYLQDAGGRQLDRNDNAGDGRNFRIVREAAAGTYYVAVVGANGRQATGAYALAAGLSGDGDGDRSPGWTPGVFRPAAQFQALCANPRSGIDPQTGAPYPDALGETLDENNWLRSWSNNLYLWYDEIEDRDPAGYDDPLDYFEILKTFARTRSGAPKDRFHYTYSTEKWRKLSSQGSSVGYGARFALLRASPPRDVRIAYVEPNSPAVRAGLGRGARILAIDGVDMEFANSQADLDVLNAGLYPSREGETHEFTVRDLGSDERRTATLRAAEIQSDPVQHVQVLETDSGPVGYLLFNAFIATAERQLIDAVRDLEAESIVDLVLDLRYNGGGYLAIASQLGFMVAGPAAAQGRVFDALRFNDKHPSRNPVTGAPLRPTLFQSTSVGLTVPADEPLPSLNLPRVFVLTGPGTCSASEAVINALRGIDLEVIQIGATTCGKPYGFYPADNCGATYFSIQFQGVNAKGFGDYSDGFSPANLSRVEGVELPGCAVADDFEHGFGVPAEARLAAALQYRRSGACPQSSGFEDWPALRRRDRAGLKIAEPPALLHGLKIPLPPRQSLRHAH